MLEVIMDKHILFILMGVFAALGVLSKCVANITLKKLVKAAGNMNKSTHVLMRLVRAKFEHACMISDKVQNVGVFVEKYLYEYKVIGLKLHSWRRLEKGTAWVCLVLGGAAALLEYSVHGMNDLVLKNGATGAGAAILLFLLHLTSDENYQIEAAKNYMVDYLENVCAHKYEKTMQKELKVMAPPEAPVPEINRPETSRPETSRPEMNQPEINQPIIEEPERPHPREEVPSPTHSPEITPPVMPEPTRVPVPETAGELSLNQQILAAEEAAEQTVKKSAKETARGKAAVKKEEEKKPVAKDVLIREILEEFLA